MRDIEKKVKLSELVASFGGELVGVDTLISGISPIDMVLEGAISFVLDEKYLTKLSNCDAIAFILNHKHYDKVKGLNLGKPLILTDNPQLYMAKVSNFFYTPKTFTPRIKASAVIDSSVIFEDKLSVQIQDYVVIGAKSSIAKNTQIHSGCVIGDEVKIGANVIIYPNVTVYSNVVIGDNTIIHAGSVIGSDGFGNALDESKQWYKIPQIGGVRIGNNVEIGANTTIDNGTFTPTIIGNGVRIDNLVQIAHNVEVGDHTAMAACVGVAGSTKIGRHCQFGGGAGINGHIEIADHCVIGGGTLISKSLIKPDLYFSVYPFTTFKEWSKNAFHIKNLHSLYLRIKELEAQMEQILNQNTESNE